MDNENQLDSIDELLFGYFENEPEEIVPQAIKNLEIGRASCRERVFLYV